MAPPVVPPALPPGYPRVRLVRDFQELASSRFENGVNALCWPRPLPGDFAEVIQQLARTHTPGDSSSDSPDEGITILDAARLRRLPVGPAGRQAIEFMLADLDRLQSLDRAPVLNCIHGYPSDDDDGPVPTDVFSFHADSAPVEADTWLCTYYGPSSEGLRNEEAQRRVDVPEIRAELLRRFGGPDDEGFHDHLSEHCYDLHYAAQPGACPFSFGVGHLWRIAVDHPGSLVPPCIHRAPRTFPGQPPRLLLIS